MANDTLLIDPGTYLYESEPRYRNYFRGTSAHNTVLVDGRDQAQQHESLTFHWLTSYFAAKIWSSNDCDGKTVVLAYHNGYADIGVIHWRAVVYDSQGVWWVWDRLVSNESHTYQLHWHVDAALNMLQNNGVIDKNGQRWTLRIDGSEDVGMHHGDCQLPLGWVSRHYGEKEPLRTLRAQAAATGSHEFITTLIAPECLLQSTGLDEVLLEQLRQHCILPITLEK